MCTSEYLLLCDEPPCPHSLAYAHSIVVAALLISLLTSAMEFVCAQSPYNMRGLLLGYVWCIYVVTYILAQLLFKVLYDLRSTHPWIVILYTGLAALLSLAGFVLDCLLARCYKRRVRDDIATPQKWVEDAYDRYLSENEENELVFVLYYYIINVIKFILAT